MKKCEMLYEGKAKKVYTTEDPELYIVDYKDDATAFNGLKKGTILGKGAINNRVTNHLMKMLETKGIPTHFVEQLSDRETVVKKLPSFRWKLSSAISQQALCPNAWALKKAKNCLLPFWNTATKTMIWATR